MVTQSRTGCPIPWAESTGTPPMTVHHPLHPFLRRHHRVPRAFAQGEIDRFSWESAWWVFNIGVESDIQHLLAHHAGRGQGADRGGGCDLRHAAGRGGTAVKLYEQDPELAKRFLTTYSVSTAKRSARALERAWYVHPDQVQRRDVRTAEEGTEGVEYPEAWLRRLRGRIPISSGCPTGAKTPSDPHRSWPARLSHRVSFNAGWSVTVGYRD